MGASIRRYTGMVLVIHCLIERGAEGAFVLATGFPRIDIKQEQQKNSTHEYATQNLLLLCAQILILEAVQSKKDGLRLGSESLLCFHESLLINIW